MQFDLLREDKTHWELISDFSKPEISRSIEDREASEDRSLIPSRSSLLRETRRFQLHRSGLAEFHQRRLAPISGFSSASAVVLLWMRIR